MNVGKGLIIAGLALLAVGVLVILAEKFGLRLFRLPGDLVWRGKNTVVYVPIVTSIVLSIVLSLLLALFLRR